jgi:hypothetical protein
LTRGAAGARLISYCEIIANGGVIAETLEFKCLKDLRIRSPLFQAFRTVVLKFIVV